MMIREKLTWAVAGLALAGMFGMVWLMGGWREEASRKADFEAENDRLVKILQEREVAAKQPSTLPPASTMTIPPLNVPNTKPTPEQLSTSPDTAISFSSEAEKFEAEMIARHVVDPLERVVKMTDLAIAGIERGPHNGMRVPDRLEFLHLAGGVIEDADEKPQVRSTYKLKRTGDRYHFNEIAAAVTMNIAAASGLSR